MSKINLLSKSIYSSNLLEKDDVSYFFPGVPDLIIAFYTIFILIMQVDSISKVTTVFCETTGLFFINSITFSVLTLHILFRSQQLCDSIKIRMQYKIILSILLVMGILTVLLFWIPNRNAVSESKIKVAYITLLLLFISNGLLLFFHTWLGFAFHDYYRHMIANKMPLSFLDLILKIQLAFLKRSPTKNASSMKFSVGQVILLSAPYISYGVCLAILYYYRNVDFSAANITYCYGKIILP